MCHITVLSESIHKARKDYNCDASYFIADFYNELLTLVNNDELKLIWAAKDNNWKIKKGEKYFRQNQVNEGSLVSFKSRKGLHEICLKYNLYPEC